MDQNKESTPGFGSRNPGVTLRGGVPSEYSDPSSVVESQATDANNATGDHSSFELRREVRPTETEDEDSLSDSSEAKAIRESRDTNAFDLAGLDKSLEEGTVEGSAEKVRDPKGVANEARASVAVPPPGKPSKKDRIPLTEEEIKARKKARRVRQRANRRMQRQLNRESASADPKGAQSVPSSASQPTLLPQASRQGSSGKGAEKEGDWRQVEPKRKSRGQQSPSQKPPAPKRKRSHDGPTTTPPAKRPTYSQAVTHDLTLEIHGRTEGSRLGEGDRSVIQGRLLEAITALPSTSAQTPLRVEASRITPTGAITMRCADAPTLQRIAQMVMAITDDQGSALYRVLRPEDRPRLVTFLVFIPDAAAAADFERIRLILRYQNPDFLVEGLHLVSTLPQSRPHGRHLLVGVEERTLPSLRRLGMEPYFGMGRIHFVSRTRSSKPGPAPKPPR